MEHLIVVQPGATGLNHGHFSKGYHMALERGAGLSLIPVLCVIGWVCMRAFFGGFASLPTYSPPGNEMAIKIMPLQLLVLLVGGK